MPDIMTKRLRSGFAVLILIAVFTKVSSITTIHHDKPEDAKPSVMATMMKKDEIESKATAANSTANLEVSERQKRLLPYMTFYLEHDFNRPQVSYNQNGQKYQLIDQQKSVAAHFQNKYNELTAQNYQPQTQHKIKITPFSDSNALPGPFVPMRGPHTVKVQETPPRQLSEIKVPNYSTIYDKLSQLKLQQQQQNQLAQSYNNFNQQYAAPNYVRKPQQIITYVPLREDSYAPPAKTYTASSIDVPSNEQYAIPVKTIQLHKVKPYESTELKAPHLDHVLPVTEEEHKQYLEDQKYSDIKKQNPKPFVIVRSKPRPQPPKFYPEEQKPYIPNQKPILVLQRRPDVQKTPYYEVPVRFNPIYRPVENYQIETTPKYINVIPNQERNPVYVTVTPKYEDGKYQVQYSIQTQNKFGDPRVKYQNPQYEYQTPVEYETTEDKYPPPPPQVQFENPPPHQNPQVQYQNPPLKSPVKYQNPHFEDQQGHIGYQQTHQNYNIQTLEGKFEPSYEEPVVQSFQPISTYAPQYVSTATEHPRPLQAEAENSNSLSVILKKLQDSNALPQTLTADNIDNSIRTLVKILSSFKKQRKFSKPIVVPEESGEYEDDTDNEAGVGIGGPHDVSSAYPENTPEGGTPGKAGVDYPALSTIPQTSFNCKTQRYKGFFGDPDTNCQVWHYCDLNGGQASFLCPNGTIFSQVALTCDWWYNVKCANTPQLYVLNERLYKYILPLSPKFPEDYSGPLVDRYLAMKFQEMEEKMKKERKKNKEDSPDKEESAEEVQDDADDLANAEKKKHESAENTTENSSEDNETDASKEQ